MSQQLGLALLYVGVVLFANGACALMNVPKKAVAVMNLFTGLVSFACFAQNVALKDYYGAATGMLFGFTYLFNFVNGWFDLDGTMFGWFQLFVAVNTIPCSIISLGQGDVLMFIIWLLWGVLWFTGFIELTLKKPLGKFVPALLIFEGIFTAWIPGFLLIRGMWPVIETAQFAFMNCLKF